MRICHCVLVTPFSTIFALNADAWLWKYAGPTPASTERLPRALIVAALVMFCWRLVLPALGGSAAPIISCPRILAAAISWSQLAALRLPWRETKRRPYESPSVRSACRPAVFSGVAGFVPGNGLPG